ncbi:MAG TPA: hypothetical protein VJ521_16435, partial [Acidobacteriota bacterium]|nr:hypothetical protein [Acidobacteriota bacterium]
MRRVTENIFLSFALGAGVGMALLVGWSLTLSNRLSANDAFPLFFLILPVVAAVYASSKPVRAKGGHWAVRWLGTTTLGLLVSGVVWGASSFIPFKPNAAYNYPRFHYSSSYEQARERLVNAGGPA